MDHPRLLPDAPLAPEPRPAPPDAPTAGTPAGASRDPATRRFRPADLVLVGAVVIGLAVAFRPAWGLVLLAAVLIPLERAFRRHDYPVFRPGWRTDVAHVLCTHLLELVCIVAAAGLTWLVLHPFTIAPAAAWIGGLPGAGRVVLAMALFQVTYYAEHRLAHRWGFLWRFHRVHHSSERLDWLAAARLHPLEAFFGGFVIAPVFVLLGFAPVAVAGLQAVETLWAVVNHSNVRWRLRLLDRVWQNPEYHHWHHSNEPEARDHNFGLPLLDTIFGTYYLPTDRRPRAYGIDGDVPSGYLAQLAWPFRRSSSAATAPGPTVTALASGAHPQR